MRVAYQNPDASRPAPTFGRDMYECLKPGFDRLFSEYAPLGTVLVPGTPAWTTTYLTHK